MGYILDLLYNSPNILFPGAEGSTVGGLVGRQGFADKALDFASVFQRNGAHAEGRRNALYEGSELADRL
jgi:hypothetical protein